MAGEESTVGLVNVGEGNSDTTQNNIDYAQQENIDQAQQNYDSQDNVSQNDTVGNTNDNTNVDTSDNQNEGVVASAKTSKGTILQVVINPQTGRRELKEVGTENATTQTEQAQKTTENSFMENNGQPLVNATQNANLEASNNSNNQVSPYSESELLLAIQTGAPVDEARLTPQMAVSYGYYKQNLAQQQAIQKAQQEQAQGISSEEEVKAAAENRNQFYKRVDQMAKENAMKELGLTEEDVEASEYSDDENLINKVELLKTAQEYHRQRILNYVEQEEQKAAQASSMQKAIYQDITNFALNAQKTEPRFNEINKELETYYTNLPYAKATKYADAVQAYRNGNITQQQTQVLQEYYEETRKYVYGRANNLATIPQKVKPPVVERAGSGASVAKPTNYAELRNLGARDREAWIRKNL